MARQEIPDLAGLIEAAKIRLAAEGKEVNALNIYRIIPTIRKELARAAYIADKDQLPRND